MAAVVVALSWLDWQGIRLSKPAILAWGILGSSVSLLIFLLASRNLILRLSAVKENALRLANQQPLDPFPPGSDEIAVLARQLETAADLMRERERDLQISEG
ncbi:MAG TPA: hypothetical protein VMA31_01360, partial [Bryobacteraceae bacterium]|nr:hypothetical protein [Bryobacteraceae bacterium]